MVPKIMPRALQERKIREELVKHGWDPEEVDVHALVDGTLSYRENRDNISKMLRYKVKNRSSRQIRAEADHGLCIHLQERCELNHEKPACRQYVKEGCHKELGDPDVPRSWLSSSRKKNRKVVKKQPSESSPCDFGSLWVNPYERFCGICYNKDGSRGKMTKIRGHCRKKSTTKVTA